MEKHMNKLIKTHLPYINLARTKPPKTTFYILIYRLIKKICFSRNDDFKDYNKIQSDFVDEIPYEDKLKFTQKIKYVNQDPLGFVVSTIQMESAEAFNDVIIFLMNFLKKNLNF